MLITEEKFDEEFTPIQNHLRPGETMFETFGPELDFVRAQPDNKVWTLMDDDDGNLVIASGFHFVNRVGYYITTVPWTENTTVTT